MSAVGTAAEAGEINLSVDGSSVPVTFEVRASADSRFELMKLRISISDSNMRFDRFGGIAALTNGLEVVGVGGLSIISSDEPVLDNHDLVAHATSSEILVWSGSVSTLTIDFDTALFGGPRVLTEVSGLDVIVNDDLTGIENFTVTAFGQEYIL